MCLPRKMLSRRVALSCTAIAALLLVLGTATIPKVSYYMNRARYHDGRARLHRSASEEYRRDLPENNVGPFRLGDGTPSMAEEEEREASRHARLGHEYRRAAFQFWRCPSQSLPLPYPWDRERDRQVLEATLLHRVEHVLSRLEPGDPDRTASRIYVDQLTAPSEMFQDWYDDDILPELLPIEVAADLQHRNDEGEIPLAEFRLNNPRIAIRDLEPLHHSDHPSDSLGFVYVSIPGFSNDGKIALVTVTNAFSEHSYGEIYALKIVDNQWRVAGVRFIMTE